MKNTPTEAYHKDHHIEEDNGNPHCRTFVDLIPGKESKT
jgi:hypothetical protein